MTMNEYSLFLFSILLLSILERSGVNGTRVSAQQKDEKHEGMKSDIDINQNLDKTGDNKLIRNLRSDDQIEKKRHKRTTLNDRSQQRNMNGQSHGQSDTHGQSQSHVQSQNHGQSQSHVQSQNHGQSQSHVQSQNHGQSQSHVQNQNHGHRQNHGDQRHSEQGREHSQHSSHGERHQIPNHDTQREDSQRKGEPEYRGHGRDPSHHEREHGNGGRDHHGNFPNQPHGNHERDFHGNHARDPQGNFGKVTQEIFDPNSNIYGSGGSNSHSGPSGADDSLFNYGFGSLPQEQGGILYGPPSPGSHYYGLGPQPPVQVFWDHNGRVTLKPYKSSSHDEPHVLPKESNKKKDKKETPVDYPEDEDDESDSQEDSNSSEEKIREAVEDSLRKEGYNLPAQAHLHPSRRSNGHWNRTPFLPLLLSPFLTLL